MGTPYLCFALSRNGYHATAVKVLLQETYPSWLYAVKRGATTIWEHWDSIKEDGSFWSDQMNSFNHYAYGAIGDWMYRIVAGLDMDKAEPAYKQIRIQPRIGGAELTYAKASYKSMHGPITSAWRLRHEEIEIEVEIPANTTADVVLPYAKLQDVRESGYGLAMAEGVQSFTETEEGVQLTVGSGFYRFVYPNERGLKVTFSEDTRIIDLLPYKEAVQVLEEYVPGATKPPKIFALKLRSLKELPDLSEAGVSAERVQELVVALNAIEWEGVLV